MKYTSVIAAAAVLSASTFAGFNVSVGAGNLVFEGKRVIDSDAMDTEIPTSALADNASLSDTDMMQGHSTSGATKNILDLRAGYSYDFSDMFTLDAGLVLSSGKLSSSQSSMNWVHDDNGSTAGVILAERLVVNLKPTYGFDVKALFNMNGVKFGPEVRIQRFEQTNEGEAVYSPTDGAITTTAQILINGAGTQTKLKTDKKDLDETMFGVAMSTKLNDKLTLSAGYLTVKAEQLKADFAAAVGQAEVRNYYEITSATATEINLTTEKPHLELYYASVGMDF